MFLHVKKAKHIEQYKVQVTFSDGRKGVADLADALEGEMFEPLRDIALFARLRVDEELETIVWPNGADLAPEFIYFQAFKNVPELQPQFRKWGYIAEPVASADPKSAR